MAAATAPKKRFAEMAGEFGAIDLTLRAAQVNERLGRLTETTVEAVSRDRALDLSVLVGKAMRIDYEDAAGAPRAFSGTCIAAEYLGLWRGLGRYALDVRPWLWMLTQNRKSRVFEEMTVVDVVNEVMGEHGFRGDVETRLSGQYVARPYCVQYRESDFAFLSRLMEEEGIYYFFEYGSGIEKMVLADDAGAHAPLPGGATLDFHHRDGDTRLRPDHVFDWVSAQRVTPGRVTLDDYDFERPAADQAQANAFGAGPHGAKGLNVYDYPGHIRAGAFGANYARVRMEAEAARHRTARAAANARGIGAGRSFQIAGHPRVKPSDEFLVVAATHDIKADLGFEEDDALRPLVDGGLGTADVPDVAGVPDGYLVRFEALPKTVPYRSPAQTPWPEIPGLQTAVVVGPEGEEIHTDRYGRIKVRFHWGRPVGGGRVSCWVRCVMPWTGKNWGMFAIPRVGQEVAIQFEEGDPDRPVCTGMLYNAATMPPYAMPDNKTQTGIVTRSSKEGSTSTFHELVFEDKKEAEFVRFQSERDYMQTIKNDATITIGLEHKDKGDLTQTIHRNKTEVLKTGDHDFKVEKGNQTVFVKKNHKETIEGTATQTIVGDTKQTVKRGDLTREVSMGSEDVTIKMGDYSLETSLGEITLEAMKKITLKVGQSSIVLDQMGVTIKGMNIKSQAQVNYEAKGLMTTVKGDVKATFQGTMTDVKGDAVLICKGGVVMIN